MKFLVHAIHLLVLQIGYLPAPRSFCFYAAALDHVFESRHSDYQIMIHDLKSVDNHIQSLYLLFLAPNHHQE